MTEFEKIIKDGKKELVENLRKVPNNIDEAIYTLGAHDFAKIIKPRLAEVSTAKDKEIEELKQNYKNILIELSASNIASAVNGVRTLIKTMNNLEKANEELRSEIEELKTMHQTQINIRDNQIERDEKIK